MGFFSWNCNECKHPMLSKYAINDINSWMTNVVVIEAGSGRLMRGEYDGYGRVDGREIRLGEWRDSSDLVNDPCCYHDACWVKADKPTSHVPSESSDDQGFFFDDEHNMEHPT